MNAGESKPCQVDSFSLYPDEIKALVTSLVRIKTEQIEHNFITKLIPTYNLM